MNVHVDDRRLFYGNIFPDAGLAGDLNVVVLQPGALIAWHRHQHQTDYLFCVKGSVKVGTETIVEVGVDGSPRTVRDDGPHTLHLQKWRVLHERNPEIVEIPPNAYHGYMNLSEGESILLSYNTQHFNPEDEERRMPEPNEWKAAPR